MVEAESLREYAQKMRSHHDSGTDLGVDARFVDMLVPRRSRILDIGCGIGSAVNHLRRSGHEAFGIDPTPAVLDIAADLFESQWFRLMSAGDLSTEALRARGLPENYDAALMSGNTPAFLDKSELKGTFSAVERLLDPGGLLIVGTTTRARGGPQDQDSCATSSALSLQHRFGDWHLGEYAPDSPWSVSVFRAPGHRNEPDGPNGIFVLRSPKAPDGGPDTSRQGAGPPSGSN